MDADRQIVFAREPANARQSGVVGSRALPGREVCQVVVTGHHLADAFPDAGEFLYSLDQQIDRAEIGGVEAAEGRVNPFE